MLKDVIKIFKKIDKKTKKKKNNIQMNSIM
jgi:hypothetical protein